MAASQSGTFSIQEFTDLGDLLVGGRVYTYIFGTTTQKVAYTDQAGTVPHTYTSDGIGGQYIGLNARGELPAPLYLTTGSYDIALKRADGSTVWTRRADPVSDAPAAALAAYIASLAASAGAALIGWIQAGAGALVRLVQDKLREHVSVLDFMSTAQKADALTGAPTLDCLGAVNAAIASLSTRGGVVDIPANTTIVVSGPLTWANGVVLQGRSSWSSRIKYTGTAGILCDLYGISRGGVKHLGLLTDGAGTTQAIRVYGNLNTIEDVYIDEWTQGGGNGWSVGWTVEGDTALANRSSSNVIRNVYANAVRTIGGRVTRAVDTFISEFRSFSIANSTVQQHLVIETGASGVYMDRVSTGYGKNGVVVQTTISTATGPYNAPPIYLFADQVLCDTTTGGSAWLFDSTLAAAVVSFVGTNCWAAGAGYTGAGALTTATANGVEINGGKGIEWHGRSRSNALNGVLVNTANAQDICIKGFITGNNRANDGDAHGVYFKVGGNNLRVAEARIGNTLDASGNQKYGVKVASGIGAGWSITGSNLADNVTGPMLISTTLNGLAIGNAPADITQDVIVGSSRILMAGGGWIHAKKAAALASAGTLAPDFAFQGATVTVRNGTNSGVASFLIDAVGTGSVKLGGAAAIVLGAPGANQLGVNATTGVVTQNWAAAQDVYVRYDVVQ